MLCALVRSAITAALGLPLAATPASQQPNPRLPPPTFTANSQQQAAPASQRPLPMPTPQVARPPPSSATAQAPGGGSSGSGGIPRVTPLQAEGVTSLTALLGQPLPPSSQPLTYPTSLAALQQAAATAPTPTPTTGNPAVATAPAAVKAAASNGGGQANTGSVSQGLPTSMPAASQAHAESPQLLSGASAVPIAIPQQSATVAATAAVPTASAPASSQWPVASGTTAQQQPQPAGAASLAGGTLLASQQAQPVLGPSQASSAGMLPRASTIPASIPRSSSALQPPALLPAQHSAAASTTSGFVSQQQTAPGVAVTTQSHARPFAPVARAGVLGVGIGQGAAGGVKMTAQVGEDVWQLASDVMAAGGTATTAAAVTTAAQQVQLTNLECPLHCLAASLMIVRQGLLSDS